MLNILNKEVKILKEHVDLFNAISSGYAEIFAKLGQITISKNNIKLLLLRLMKLYSLIQSKLKLLVLTIRKHYGNGKINTLSWTFKPEQ